MHKKIKEIFNFESFEFVFAIVLVGVSAGFVSYLLHEGVHYITPLLKTNMPFTIKTTMYSLGAAFLSMYLTKTIFKDTKGSGIPQVKLALVALRGRMPKRLGIGKFITTALTLVSGLSFGKEGPCVTISSALAYLYGHIFNLSIEHKKTLVTSGASAGLSAAFFSPISAVAFTMEEIVGGLNTKFLTPIMISSCIAAATSYELLGSGKSTFSLVHYSFSHKINLFYYLALGLLIGLIGVFWAHCAVLLKKFKSKVFHNFDYIYLLFAVLLIAAASNVTPDILGDGVEVINEFIKGREISFAMLFAVFLLKLFTSSISYSTGLSGGLFMPVLFLGAASGLLIGKALVYMGVPNIEVGVFALLGMTSMLVAVIRTPFTAFIMLFEMTRDYDLILPLMISSVVSYYVANLITEESIYEILAEYEGVHLPTEKDNETMSSMQIEECFNANVFSLNHDFRQSDLVKIKAELKYSGYPVLKDGFLLGLISKTELLNFIENDEIGNDLLESVCKKDIISIYPDQSFLVAFEKMKRFNVSRLPVVSRFNTRRLVGIVTAKDIVDFFELAKSSDVELS